MRVSQLPSLAPHSMPSRSLVVASAHTRRHARAHSTYEDPSPQDEEAAARLVEVLTRLEASPSPRASPLPVAQTPTAPSTFQDASGFVHVDDYARLDIKRQERTGLPEFVFGPGKTVPQISAILEAMAARGVTAIATRIEPERAQQILALQPKAVYEAEGRLVVLRPPKGQRAAKHRLPGKMALLAAGTADKAVAEECRLIAQHLGVHVETYYDIGVAALQRLLDVVPAIRECQAVVCVAGMEAALPSVVAGLVDAPVIAVPTSVGYGASFNGISALLTSLNSCAPGVVTCNIDNGFGAAAFVAKMFRQMRRSERGRAAQEEGRQQSSNAVSSAAPTESFASGGASTSGQRASGEGAGEPSANGAVKPQGQRRNGNGAQRKNAKAGLSAKQEGGNARQGREGGDGVKSTQAGPEKAEKARPPMAAARASAALF